MKLYAWFYNGNACTHCNRGKSVAGKLDIDGFCDMCQNWKYLYRDLPSENIRQRYSPSIQIDREEITP